MNVYSRLAQLRSRVGQGTETAAGLGIAALVGNVIALAFTVVMARALGTDGYGSLAALVSAFLIASIAGSALQITVAREVSVENERHDPGLVKHVRAWIIAVVLIAIGAAVIGIALRTQIAELIGVEDSPWAASAVLASGAAWLLLSTLRGVLQGLQRYKWVGWSIVGEAALRLTVAVVLVEAGLDVTGGFLASGLSILLMSLVLMLPLGMTFNRRLNRESTLRIAHETAPQEAEPTLQTEKSVDWRFTALVARTWSALIALSLIALLQNSDVIMVKREATEAAAGAYAADAVASKVILWIAIGLGFYVVPEAARLGEGKDARRVVLRATGLVALVGAAMVAIYAIAGKELLEIAFGDEYGSEASALPLLGAAMVLLSTTYLICQLFLALGKIVFLFLLAVGVAVQIAVLSRVAESPHDTAMAMLAIQFGVAMAMVLTSGLLTRASVEN